ncbi:galanin receptor type 1-like [Lytechinus pictus]|uniref:galanin receptor type 1-like n=1 Tax=Lytechinus pictus TaxID=7653 RepID=UPI0030BA07B2
MTTTSIMYSVAMAMLNATAEPYSEPEPEPESEPEPEPETIMGSMEPEPWITGMLSGEPFAEISSEPVAEPEPTMNFCVQVILALIAAIILVVGTVGNALVIAVISRMRADRTVTELFLLSLAIADVFVCVICTPLIIVGITVQQGHTGVSYIVEQVMFYFSSVASILSLSAIALDRHDAVIHPMSRRLNIQRSKQVLVVIWLISSAAAVTIFFIPQKYEFAVLAVFFIVPLVFMVACYYRIVRVARQAASRVRKASEAGMRKTTKSPPRMDKTLRMVIVVLVIFVISWLPSLISRLLKYTMPMTAGQKATMEVTACLIAYAGSALNFVVYAFMSRKFQRGLITLLGCQRYFNRKVDPDTKPKSDIGKTCIHLAVEVPVDDDQEKNTGYMTYPSISSRSRDVNEKHLL